MQAKSASRTFTEAARRAQIVDAAIETLAELGYRRTTFTQIARRAGLSSTGLISYHFAGKDELIEQVVTRVYTEIQQFMAGRMQPGPDPAETLRRYIGANIEFIGTHRIAMKALLEVFLNGGLHYDATAERTVMSPIEDILRAGQATGQFRAFDTRVMATLIQRAIDGLPLLLDSHPDLDPDGYATEVMTVFDLATRSNG